MRNILKVVFGRVLFTVLCLIIQLIWIIALVWKLNQYYVWFATVIEIIGIIVVLRINAKSDNSAARLVWTIVILSLPLFGITLYLMFGRTGLTKRTKAHYEKVAGKFSPELKQKRKSSKASGEKIFTSITSSPIFSIPADFLYIKIRT